jgi:hypothetical protein
MGVVMMRGGRREDHFVFTLFLAQVGQRLFGEAGEEIRELTPVLPTSLLALQQRPEIQVIGCQSSIRREVISSTFSLFLVAL